MEYSNYITERKFDLLRITRVNSEILSACKEHKILPEGDIDGLGSVPSRLEQSRRFWNLIQKKKKCWELLIEIFRRDGQSKVVDLLEDGVRDDGRKSLFSLVHTLEPLQVKVQKLPEADEDMKKGHYKLDIDKIGLALVINIHYPETDLQHEVAHKHNHSDSDYMSKLWSQLGYQVIVHQGEMKVNRFRKIIDEFLTLFEKRRTPMSCVVFVGAHGRNREILMSDGQYICLWEDLVYKIASSKRIVNKPKLFILSMCFNEPCPCEEIPYPPLKHTVVCHPELPKENFGIESQISSYFVYIFTKIFMEYAHARELSELLEKVKEEMENAKLLDFALSASFRYHKYGLKSLYFNPLVREIDNK